MIAEEISMIIHTKAADSRLSDITITGAKISKDMRIAHVFVSFLMDTGDVETKLRSLRQAAGFFRTELGHRLQLKFVPEIRFLYDDSIERGQRIMNELDTLGISESEGETSPGEQV